MKSFLALVVLASIAFECESKGIRFPLRRFPKIFPKPKTIFKHPTNRPATPKRPTTQPRNSQSSPPSRAPKKKEAAPTSIRDPAKKPKSKNLPEARKKKKKEYEDDEIPTGDDSPDEEAEAEDKPESPIEDVVAGAKKDGAESTEDSSDMEKEYSGLD
ncbi:hypothetical protein DSO57_1023439 [Entomophthora muscae]|uniref:Uncharacterized protein n=1 Tax=Entomophthora muscae TaxID=34485 RepID=A0ACC2UNF6_9FUNG|nr:hypothetical protein DSO57_1023439 [Entomophthora muscae]